MSDAALLDNVLLFGRVLRGAGLDVDHGRMLDAVRALGWMASDVARMSVPRCGRCSFTGTRIFLGSTKPSIFSFVRIALRRRGPPLFSFGERPRVVARPAQGVPVSFEGAGAGGHVADRSFAVGAYSAAEISRTRDFADFTDAELARATALLAALPWHLGVRRTRRWEAAQGTAIDLRVLARRNLMRGGDPLELPRRRRREAPRPVIVLADVSGSMERYSRMLLHFAYGLAQSTGHVESFVFATRLTRVTRGLTTRGAERALSRLVERLQDWGGGTRIGEALRTFNVHWARRVMRHGPVVLIVSDGWDRGDPELLARELARVRRSCRRLVWLNPLLGSANYEPLTRGMQAALRHVDDFMPAHNLASLEDLARHLCELRAGRHRAHAA